MSKESPIVDSSVHIFFRHNEELRDYLEEPWKSRGIPHVEMDWYGAPDGEYSKTIAGDTEGYPGSDPATGRPPPLRGARGRHRDPAPDDARAPCRTSGSTRRS